jgi:DNA-binding transcriptional LysR family regulator
MAPPDWVTLRIFLAAIELGSVTRAGERCGIATSAAAKRIQDLELDAGVVLLERGARGVRPTPAGEALAQHARALLDLAARLGDDLRAFAAGGVGSVRLRATTSAITGHQLAEALAAFAAERPGVRVELDEGTSLAILQDLLEGRGDLGIVTSTDRVPAGLDAYPWHEDHLLAVMPAGHRLASRDTVAFAELLDEPLVGVLANGSLSLLIEDQAQRLGRQPHHRFTVGSTDAARRLVAAGHGVTIMPDGVARPYLAPLGLCGVPVAEPWARRRLALVGRPAGSLPAPARLLLEHLRAPAQATSVPD